MDRLGARAPRHVEDLLHVQVGFRRWPRPQVVGLAGARGVRPVAIELRVDRHALRAQLLQRAHHADGDLAAVGDQYLRKHLAGQLS